MLQKLILTLSLLLIGASITSTTNPARGTTLRSSQEQQYTAKRLNDRIKRAETPRGNLTLVRTRPAPAKNTFGLAKGRFLASHTLGQQTGLLKTTSASDRIPSTMVARLTRPPASPLVLASKLFAINSMPPGAINVLDYGLRNDGTSSVANRANLLALFAANPNGTLYFPAGTYSVDNYGTYPQGTQIGALQIQGFNGSVEFQAGARLVMTDNTQGGIYFEGGTGAHLINIRIGYQTPPPTRTNLPALDIFRTTGTKAINIYIEDSPGGGVFVDQSINPEVHGAQIVHSMADGIQFANCQNPIVEDETTTFTGDDGLSFVNYAKEADNTGGIASNITINNSAAHGIAVVGQSDVRISTFSVNGSAADGVFVAYDGTYNTRIPSNVTVENGAVSNFGAENPQQGIRSGLGDAYAQSVSFRDILIAGGTGRGVAAIAPAGTLELSNVFITDTTIDGIVLTAESVTLDSIVVAQVGGYGLYVAQSSTVMAKTIFMRDVSTAGGLNRAMWFDRNASLAVKDVQLVDDQIIPTGFIIGEANNATGNIDNVTYEIAYGRFVCQNLSKTVSFGWLTPTDTPGAICPAVPVTCPPVNRTPPRSPRRVDLIPFLYESDGERIAALRVRDLFQHLRVSPRRVRT